MKLTSTLFFLFLVLQFQAQSNQDGNPISQTDEPFISFETTVLGNLATIEAGDDVEGDFIGEYKYTPDGQQLWVAHRITNNITVINTSDKSIIQNIPLGTQPMDIGFSDDYAVVPCFSSNEVYIIDRTTFDIVLTESVSDEPAKVDVSPSGNIAVVGCESDVAEVFDLQTLQKTLTIPLFPVFISKFAFITSNPRQQVYFSNFKITEDD